MRGRVLLAVVALAVLACAGWALPGIAGDHAWSVPVEHAVPEPGAVPVHDHASSSCEGPGCLAVLPTGPSTGLMTLLAMVVLVGLGVALAVGFGRRPDTSSSPAGGAVITRPADAPSLPCGGVTTLCSVSVLRI